MLWLFCGSCLLPGVSVASLIDSQSTLFFYFLYSLSLLSSLFNPYSLLSVFSLFYYFYPVLILSYSSTLSCIPLFNGFSCFLFLSWMTKPQYRGTSWPIIVQDVSRVGPSPPPTRRYSYPGISYHFPENNFSGKLEITTPGRGGRRNNYGRVKSEQVLTLYPLCTLYG